MGSKRVILVILVLVLVVYSLLWYNLKQNTYRLTPVTGQTLMPKTATEIDCVSRITNVKINRTDKLKNTNFQTKLQNGSKIRNPEAQNRDGKLNLSRQSDAKEYGIIQEENPMKSSHFIYDTENVYTTIQTVKMKYKPPKNEKCKKRVPQCIILGVRKAGTRELIDYMGLHPNIVIKRKPYELGYFTSKHYKPNTSGIEWYREQMPCSYSDQVTVVKYPWYFSSPQAAERIHRFNKTIKLIAIVREPVKRLIAGFTFTYRQRTFSKQGENLSKLPPIGKDLLRKDGAINEKYEEVQLSSYDDSLSYYLKYFTMDQILIVESNEFKYSPHLVLKRIEAFLGLKSIISEDYFVFNSEKNFYCIRYNNSGSCYGILRGRETQPNVSEETMDKLQKYFRTHNERFYRMIGKRYNW